MGNKFYDKYLAWSLLCNNSSGSTGWSVCPFQLSATGVEGNKGAEWSCIPRAPSQPHTKGRMSAAVKSTLLSFYRKLVFVRQESTAAQQWSSTSHTRQVDTKMPLFYFDCFQKSKHFQTQLRYKIQHKMRIYTYFFFFFFHIESKNIFRMNSRTLCRANW